jgi:hypothetical protein
MKKHILIITGLVTVLAGLGSQRASAQIFGSDSAQTYTSWGSGTTGGIGFQPWIMENTGGAGGFGGTFLGNGGEAIDSPNGNYWGMYANSSSTAASEAFRAFSNSLPVNATFQIAWHNEGIGFSSGNAAGFNLRTGNNTNLQTAATFLNDNSVFAFYYIGGGSDNYVVYDGNGVNTVPLGFSSSPFIVQVTLLPGSMYNLTIENAAGTAVLWSTNNQPLATGGTIDSVATYAFDTSGNQAFNNLEILNLAPQVANLTPASGSVYVAAGSQLSFAVESAASTIVSNKIQLTLNGVLQTGANWTVLNSGTSSNEVTLNTPLQGNLVYNGTIIATDQAGNSSTNSISFNTWLPAPNNIYIESGDYNWGAGQYVLNTALNQPNQIYGQNDLLGTNGIDYFVYMPLESTNWYRPGDYPALETNLDVDHDNFANNGFQAYDLAFNRNGQWEDYTRALSNNVTYAVYARMAGFGNNTTMALSRMATAQVSNSNQPNATLGTFVCPQTGGAQDWTFVPLNDFFSNPVLINFGGTNTFQITDLGNDGSYNLGYLLLVATTNAPTLRPYVSAGFPYPGLTGVTPGQAVSFTIANRTTSVSPGSIQLFLNSNSITGSITLSNNAAGTVVNYQPTYPNLLPAGTDTLQVIYSDGSVSETNAWQFTVETLPTLSAAWAIPLSGSYSRGISELIAKGDDSATNIDFPPNIARALAQLAGTLTNSTTGIPYANEALNSGVYTEPDTINYALDPRYIGLFTPTNLFPDITPGTTNNVAMEANMYVYLTPGLYNFDVYSDDGFQFSAGPTPTSTNDILGIANFGRPPESTEFSFIVTTTGLYPMQLIYFKAQTGGGGVELYSINQTNGASVLLNDPNNAGAVQVYYQAVASRPVLTIAPSGSQVVLSWTDATYSLQSAPVVTGPYTTISGATSPYHYTITGTQEYFRLAH